MKWNNNGVKFERGNYECLIAKYDEAPVWFALRGQAMQQAQKSRFKQLGALFKAAKYEVMPMYNESEEWTQENIVVFDFAYSGECRFFRLHENGAMEKIQIKDIKREGESTMNEERRMYRMTEEQRQYYLLLLLSGREDKATALREEWDEYWSNHPDEWEKARVPDNQPAML